MRRVKQHDPSLFQYICILLQISKKIDIFNFTSVYSVSIAFFTLKPDFAHLGELVVQKYLEVLHTGIRHLS